MSTSPVFKCLTVNTHTHTLHSTRRCPTDISPRPFHFPSQPQLLCSGQEFYRKVGYTEQAQCRDHTGLSTTCQWPAQLPAVHYRASPTLQVLPQLSKDSRTIGSAARGPAPQSLHSQPTVHRLTVRRPACAGVSIQSQAHGPPCDRLGRDR